MTRRAMVAAAVAAVASMGCGSERDEREAGESRPASTAPVGESPASPGPFGDDAGSPRTDAVDAAPDVGTASAPPSASDVDRPMTTGPEEERALAERRLLQLADLPPGWTERPDDDGPRSDAVRAAARDYAACVGTDGERMFDVAGTAASTGVFVNRDGSTVRHTVAVDELAVVEAFMSRFAADGVAACLASTGQVLFEASFADAHAGDPRWDEAVIGSLVVERSDIAPAGDETVAYRFTIPLSSSESDVEIVTEIVATRIGDTLSGLTFEAVGDPFNEFLRDRIVELATDRIGGETTTTAPADTAAADTAHPVTSPTND